MTIGKRILDLCEQASEELVLVAPFVKTNVMEYLLCEIDDTVKISCVTRWRPNEIKSGFSDLGVWEVIQKRRNAQLYLLPNLHAKFYRADENCLIGSANLTLKALGWSAVPNAELMVSARFDATLMNWEKRILAKCVEASQSLKDEMQRLVDLVPSTIAFIESDMAPGANLFLEGLGTDIKSWYPALRLPDQLYKAYVGQTEGLTSGAKDSALADLGFLDIEPGLSIPAFNVVVAAIMLQNPTISKIDVYLASPRRFGEVRAFLKSLDESHQIQDPSDSWQTLMRWLLYFLPERYGLAVPHHSEIMYRVGH